MKLRKCYLDNDVLAVLTLDGKDITDDTIITSFYLYTPSDEPVVVVEGWGDGVDEERYVIVWLSGEQGERELDLPIRISFNGDPWGLWDEYPAPVSDHPDVIRLWPNIVAALNPPDTLIRNWIEIAKRGGHLVPSEVAARLQTESAAA